MTIQLFNGEGYRTFPIPESKFSILKFFQKKTLKPQNVTYFGTTRVNPVFNPVFALFLPP